MRNVKYLLIRKEVV